MVPRVNGERLIEDEGLPRLSSVEGLDIVNLDILAATRAASVAVTIAVFVELETAVAILVCAKGIRLVDLGRIWELAVGLPVWVLDHGVGMADVGENVQ